jgi:Protein of unknown function (DUF3122)
MLRNFLKKFARNFMMNSICFNRSKMLLVRCLLIVCVGSLLVLWSPLPVFATISKLEEYPGQMLYQSRQTLQDQTGKSWQAIVFKRVHPEGTDTVSLRLIGFPGAIEFDHTQPLTLLTPMGKLLTAKDISNDISQDNPPPSNVAEYDVKAILPQLKIEKPIKLTLPVSTGSAIELDIPFTTIQEWQTISTRYE